MKYRFEAISRDGEMFSGLVDAVGEREALRQIEAQGASALSIDGVDDVPRGRGGRLRSQDVVQALDEFCTLLESEIGVAEAIEALLQADYHRDILGFFNHVNLKVQSGENLSEAFRSASLDLPNVVLQLVESGEATGELAECLREAVGQLQYSQRVQREFRNALTYPAILVLSGIGAIGLIFVFVVPRFASLVRGNDDMPWLASVVINGGMWFNAHWYLILAAVVAIALAVTIQLRDVSTRRRLLNGAAELPLIGIWLNERDIGNWSSSMAALLNNRVELVLALKISLDTVQLDSRKQRLQRVDQAVRGGDSLAAALEDNRVLQATAYNLVRVGEKTGRLPQMMRSVANICEENRKNRTTQLLALIEPVAILVIGLVIGVLILGVILAITSVNDVAL
ncbi:MAG: type II secretion system F family protein [Pseudomonadota bacterium]